MKSWAVPVTGYWKLFKPIICICMFFNFNVNFNLRPTHAMGWRERHRTTQNSVCGRCFSGLDNIRVPGCREKYWRGTNFVCGAGSCLEPAVSKREWAKPGHHQLSRWWGTLLKPEGASAGQWKISWSARMCDFDSLTLTRSQLLSFGVK